MEVFCLGVSAYQFLLTRRVQSCNIPVDIAFLLLHPQQAPFLRRYISHTNRFAIMISNVCHIRQSGGQPPRCMAKSLAGTCGPPWPLIGSGRLMNRRLWMAQIGIRRSSNRLRFQFQSHREIWIPCFYLSDYQILFFTLLGICSSFSNGKDECEMTAVFWPPFATIMLNCQWGRVAMQ